MKFVCPLLVLVVSYGCIQSLDNGSLAFRKPYQRLPEEDRSNPEPTTQKKHPIGVPNRTQTTENSVPSSTKDTTEKEIASVSPDKISSPQSDQIASKPESEPSVEENISPSEPPPALSPQKTQLTLDEALDFCQASQDFWQKGDLENAVEALDQAYSLILKIDNESVSPELLQQKEDLRFTISKRILEIYASRNIVVNGNHKAIPILMNPHIKREIINFTQGREKGFFKAAYRRSGRYRPKILIALKEAGLPAELSWLPLIESGFKVKALSRARALGLWQFIPSTGYKFGLKRDYYVDHRLDPEKSTRAAIDYLKELHRIFGDWTTVLAAYNCGEGRVLRVIRSQNVNYLDNFWDLYERLPRETARYVPRYLATLHILNHAEQYGIDRISVDPPLEFETTTLNRSVHLRETAKILDVPATTMYDLNPELRYKVLPPETYTLRIPSGKKEILIAKLDELPKTPKHQTGMLKHRVRRGETVSKIAKRYGTSSNAIRYANNLNRRNFIVTGQVLNIPTSKTVVYKTPKYTPPKRKKTTTHVVKGGDSLWIIAKQYGTTTKQIQQANGLTGTRLSIGQSLKIPTGGVEPPSKEKSKTYRVRRGDSPFRIAQRHKISLEQLLRNNKLTPRSRIYPGQVLYID
jgi:membrane-bound lytic murein transglycosylase D